ncbi:MAG TPA: ATP-binding protein [Catenuloplanes sp.]|jgi:hypothetical protein
MVEHSVGSSVAVQDVQLASIVRSSHDAIVGMTGAGIITSCNEAGARLYGYTAAELIGKPADVLVPPDRRGDEAGVLERILAGDVVEGYRTERLRQDGSVITVQVTISPIVDGATVLGAATIAHRVTDERDPDELAAWIDRQPGQARDAVDPGQLDIQGLRTKSRAVEDKFQLRMEDERARERLQVQDAQDRFERRMGEERAHERAEAQDAQDRFQDAMARERIKERVEVKEAQDRFQVRMDDERTTERLLVQEAKDRFQVGMDAERAHALTDREHLQAQLQQSQRLEVLGQLAGGVAHDFNNLLAVILSYAAFVDEELAAGAGANFGAASRDVKQIQRAAERATGLTHQLLAFARREVVQPQVLDLNEVVTQVRQLLARTIGEDIVLRTDLADDLWSVMADAGQVEQVLVNLAVNARDAMGGGGTLSIDTANITVGPDGGTADPTGGTGRRVRLRVADTGTGMTHDVLAHVFEPFFTTKPDGTGTGLGLSTVYGIVTQAEATIEVQSEPAVGTTFTILLPVTDEVAVAAPDEPPHQRSPKGETLLIVEDEEALREVTERIFTSGGYHVITAANGAEAVALAAAHQGEIHLLVTDVVMPNMLGKEAAERIRALKPGIEVLYMSGYAQPVLASQGRLDPDVHLIEKPFSASSLIEKAGQVLNGHFSGFHTVPVEEPAAPVDVVPAPESAG